MGRIWEREGESYYFLRFEWYGGVLLGLGLGWVVRDEMR